MIEKAKGKDAMQQQDSGATTWIEVHGPDGTPDGTPVLVNDGPSEFVTGTAGPIAASRYRFTLTSGGQEYSAEHDCEGGTEGKPQRVEVTTLDQERDPVQPRVEYACIEVHGPDGTPDGISVDIDFGHRKTETGMPYNIPEGSHHFSLKWNGNAYEARDVLCEGGTQDKPQRIDVTAEPPI